jgi:hypothetical protein
MPLMLKNKQSRLQPRPHPKARETYSEILPRALHWQRHTLPHLTISARGWIPALVHPRHEVLSLA